VLTVDVAPSILELCGASPLPNIQGRSWKKLAQGGDSGWRKAWVYSYNYEKQFPYTPNVRGIRTDDWKYIHYPHGDGSPDRHMAELYNLRKDPAELRNLANDPGSSARRKKLEDQLEAMLSAEGLGGGNDRMPLDEGVKAQLPERGIR
jgi:N-acetylglucosamine-6-sulfatase